MARYRLNKAPECRGCPLETLGRGFSQPEGSCVNGVAVIGEACGEHEAKDGYPFRPYAESGSLLNRALKMAGTDRAQVGLFNIIACQPPANELVGANYEQAAINHCRVHLVNALERMQPKAILAVGAVASRALTGLAGDRLSLEYIRGFAVDGTYYNQRDECIPVVPTYHPQFIKRGNWAMLPVLAKDIQYAAQVAKYGPLPTDNLRYVTDAQPYDLEAFRDNIKANPDIVLSTDVETNYAELKEEIFNEDPEMGELPVEKIELLRRLDARKQEITQVNLSVQEGTGLVAFATPSNMVLVKEIHALDRVQCGHNLLMFDKDVYEDGGVPLLGYLEDTMWCLRGDTRVALWSGEYRFIQEIVDNRQSVTLKGMEDDGRIVPIEISDWHRTVVNKQTWLRITTDGSRYPIICTPDHEVRVDAGIGLTHNFKWVRAEDLVINDQIHLPSQGSWDLIHGSLLGDGYLHEPSRTLRLLHGMKQLEYLSAKAAHLGAEVNINANLKHPNAQASVVISRSIFSQFYAPDGSRKFVAPSSPATTAIWYMDDGSMTINYLNGVPSSSPRIIFAVDWFESQIDEVANFFISQYGEAVRIHKRSSGRRTRVCISRESAISFFSDIAPWIHPSMDYKLPLEYRGRYNGWLSDRVSQSALVTGVSEIKYQRQGVSNNTRYCLTVDHPSHGFFTAGGFVHNCFHWLYPDLPGKRGKLTKGGDRSEDGSVANLQFCASFYGYPLPWKHLSGSDAGFYGCADADASLRVYWGTHTDMEQLGIVEEYYSRVVRLMPVLERMRKRGMPVSKEKVVALLAELNRQIRLIDGDIQLLAPREILPLHPPAGWKKTPKGAEDGKRIEIRRKKNGVPFTIPATLMEIEVDLPAEQKTCCMRARKPSRKTGLVDSKYVNSSRAHFRGETLYAPDPDCAECGGTGVVALPERVERRWAAEMPFNAGSPAQMWEYVHFRGYQVPKNSKRKFAMDAETVEKLEKKYKDPLFGHCNRKRRYGKLASTYCGGFMPGEDGRVHPQIGPYPSSGQLAGRKPNPQNVLNLSKIGDPVKLQEALVKAKVAEHQYEIGRLQDTIARLHFATEFRDALHAEPDHVIIEGDFSGFHVGTLGYEAGDPTYIRLSKIDIHSFFATVGILGVERSDNLLILPDAELKAKLKWYRKSYTLKDGTPFETLRNKQAKVAVLAYGLGQGYNSLYLQNTDNFNSPTETQRVVAAMDSTFPKEKLYRDTMPLTVKPNGYKLRNRFGFTRWFFDVQRYDFRKGEWRHGDDWEAAIAFNVQASAHGHLRECVMICEDLGYNERYGFDNTVHDSLRYHCHKSLAEECIHNVKLVMEAPSEVMLMPWDDNKGIQFVAEFKRGSSWGAEMKEVHV